MTIKYLMATASFALLATSGSALAQSQGDLTGQALRIQLDDCPMGQCGDAPENAADALVILQDLISSRDAMISASNANRSLGRNYKKGWNRSAQAGNNDTQVVYLEFGSADPTFLAFNSPGVPIAGGVFNDYIYTQEDRDLIQGRLEADYEGYAYEFTQVQPAQGDFSTLRIGDNDANPIIFSQGILFGRADNIDFGNDNRNDTAFVDASFWQLLAELDANFGTQNLSFFLNIPFDLTPEQVEEVRVIAVVNQSANTASHELGHIQGLRHHDSFGAPGDGLPPARDPGEFIPVLETDQNALETLTHVMASGASAGLALNSPPFVDRFFSERSAVKLGVNRMAREVTERRAKRALFLRRIVGPNPILDGENAGLRLDIRAGLVKGELSEPDEADHFPIVGRAGDVLNIEAISFSDDNVANPVLGKLTLSQRNRDGSFTEVAANHRTFEGFEPLIFDFTLPETGLYRITFEAPDVIPFPDGSTLSLTAAGLADLRVGDYNVLAYTVEGKEQRERRREALSQQQSSNMRGDRNKNRG